MGQIHSSSRRASRANASEQHTSASSSPESSSSSAPGAQNGDAVGGAVVGNSSVPSRPAARTGSGSGSGSARSLSRRLQRLSIRPQPRDEVVAEDVLAESSPAPPPPVTKRQWLRNLRSRSPRESSSKAPDAELPAAEASMSTPAPAPASPVQSRPSSAAAGAAPAAEAPPAAAAAAAEHASAAPRAHAQTEQPSPATAPSTAAADASARGPPAGGLIIVQGIVHAQDNSAPSLSSSSPPSAPEATSSAPAMRPSGFLNRSASARSPSRPHSFSHSPSTASSSSETHSPALEPTNPTHTAASPADNNNDSTQLSQSSIEVLGTLLSFATAATAASLVTGSIDPLFHSGLAASPNSPPADASPAPRPRSLFGGVRDRLRGTRRREAEESDPSEDVFGELARAINVATERTQQAADAAAAPSARPPNSSAASSQVESPATAEQVEAAEPQEPPSQQRESPATATATASAPAPPVFPFPSSTPRAVPLPRRQANDENSFERFLQNLQADLRTALSEDYTRPANTTGAASSASSSASTVSSAATTDETASSSSPENVVTPPAADAAESPSGQAGSAGSDDDVAPRANDINWWRLYRFPPRFMPPGTAVLAVPSDAPTPPAPLPSETTSPESTEPRPPTPVPADSRPDDNEGAASTGRPRPRVPALVVPIIVVGLQSVSHWEATAILSQEGLPGVDTVTSVNPAPAPSEPRRREPTLARAARAINRLSNIPRRSDSPVPAPATEPASAPAPSPAPQPSPPPPAGRGRTFLIYVIGGYYPLDHSLVTGDLTSFEALWQLAELLGQVKPPVATREEIDRSGLEILKAKALPQYQNDGRVAENTVERCLVCLDDYEDEDDVRLLSCRHAFHKDCVDKWLEEGKNNCPACRAKGVPTGSDAAPESAEVLNDTVLEPRA